MTRRPAGLLRIFPARLEEPLVAETQQERIERAGLEARLPGQVIAVAPRSRLLEQSRKHSPGLA